MIPNAKPSNEIISLSAENLTSIKEKISVPSYDRSKLAANIVHLGVGGFHRAHQANYIDMFLRKHPDVHEWGIYGVGTLPADKSLQESLAAQNFLYTLVEVDKNTVVAKIAGSIVGGSLAPDNPQLVVDRIAHKDTRIVSMSVTTNGYFVHPETMAFKIDHPDIQHDLSQPHSPKTVPGLVLYGLAKRAVMGLKGLTVLSCDNLPGNGKVIRSVILAMAEAKDPKLKSWIQSNVSFPSSMVDRITPVPTKEDRQLVIDKFGIADNCAVKCEPFIQWIIEDAFVAGRPALESVGAQFVQNVEPYEAMKMRLLNASHSALSYLGMLCDYSKVDQVMTDADLSRYVRDFMDEVTPTLQPLPGIDFTQYKDTLVARYSNPEIGDQLTRIAHNGSLRLAKFLLPSLEDNLKNRRPVIFAVAAIAFWIYYLTGTSVAGKPLVIDDVNAGKFAQCRNPEDILDIFLPSSDVFLPFKQQVIAFYRKIKSAGVREALSSTRQSA